MDTNLADLSDDNRRLGVLRFIASRGGSISPHWAPDRRLGYYYFATSSTALDDMLEKDLLYLQQGDYVEKIFHDRLTRCPSCSSQQVNVREVCPSCGSSHLVSQPLLHHFRCGFVGPIEQFEKNNRNNWICPKCNGTMSNLGTDYESPGDHFSCRNCFASFQDASVEGFCLACSVKTPAARLVNDDVFIYRLSRLGHAALRSGRLFAQENELLVEGTLPLYRNAVVMALLTDEWRKVRRYKINCSIIVVRARYAGTEDVRAAAEERLLKYLDDMIRDVDMMGRLTDDSYVISLPATPVDGAKVLLRRVHEGMRIEGVRMAAHLVDLQQVEDLPDTLRTVDAALAKGQLAQVPGGVAP